MDVSAVDFHARGRRFERCSPSGGGSGPARRSAPRGRSGPQPRDGEPELIIGGSADAAFRRAARYDAGWIMGSGTPDQFREGKAKTEEAWRAAGREGKPRTLALAYYAWLGEVADMIAGSAAIDATTVKGYMSTFADAGCDELILFPRSPDLDQVDLLADAVL